MAAHSQPHLLTNPSLDDPILLGQLEKGLLPQVSARLSVIRMEARNAKKVTKARRQWRQGKIST